jgi:hypothetical protein
MTSAPGSWSPPGLQGLNGQGASKVHRGFAEGVEAGQKAQSAGPADLRGLFRPSHLERKFVTLYDSSNLYGGERLWRMQV